MPRVEEAIENEALDGDGKMKLEGPVLELVTTLVEENPSTGELEFWPVTTLVKGNTESEETVNWLNNKLAEDNSDSEELVMSEPDELVEKGSGLVGTGDGPVAAPIEEDTLLLGTMGEGVKGAS